MLWHRLLNIGDSIVNFLFSDYRSRSPYVTDLMKDEHDHSLERRGGLRLKSGVVTFFFLMVVRLNRKADL